MLRSLLSKIVRPQKAFNQSSNIHKKLTKEETLKKALENLTGRQFLCDPHNVLEFKTPRGTFLRPDSWSQQLKLVVEYNGPTHYDPGNTEVTRRDIEKRKICRRRDIMLVVVPMCLSESLFKHYLYFSLVVSESFTGIKNVRPKKMYTWVSSYVGYCLVILSRNYLRMPSQIAYVVDNTDLSNTKYYIFRLVLKYVSNCGSQLSDCQLNLPFHTLVVVCWRSVPLIQDAIPSADIHIPIYLFRTYTLLAKYFASFLMDTYDGVTLQWKKTLISSSDRKRRLSIPKIRYE